MPRHAKRTEQKKDEIARLCQALEEKARGELSQFTSRELMAELHRRGYTGTLEYTETHTIRIDKL